MKNATNQTLALYARHLRPYLGATIFVVACVVANSILHNIVPLYFKDFFDILSTHSAADANVVGMLLTVLAYIAGLEGINWILRSVAGFCISGIQSNVLADLHQLCFDNLHRHSFSFFHNNFVGGLVKRVNRFVNVFELLFDQILWNLISAAVNVITILVILTARSLWLGVIVLGWTIAFLILNWFLTKIKTPYDIHHAEAETKVSSHLADTVSNSVSLKLFNGYQREKTFFAKLLTTARDLQNKRWTLDSWFDAAQTLLIIILEIGIFYAAIRLWHQGILTAGDFVLIQSFLISLFTEVWGVGRTLRRISEGLSEAQEMTTILQTPFEILDKPGAQDLRITSGELVFKNISFTYHAKRSIFDGLSLAIAPQQKVALVGPSGSGKSTIVKLLMRMYDLDGGSIKIDGQDITEVTQESLWASMSLVPQDPVLFHRPLIENIRYGKPDATDEEVVAAAKLAHCHEFIEKLSEGYQTMVGERGVKLSGGERQRIAIARAILRNAPILILDEATSSLDSESEHLIQDALDHAMQSKTVLVIAHRLSTIMQMDRIIVLQHGKLIEDGTHAELVKQRGMYAGLWKLQAGGFIE